MAQHKWHKEIKAWADGAEIESKDTQNNNWASDYNPYWDNNDYEFRIKDEINYSTDNINLTPENHPRFYTWSWDVRDGLIWKANYGWKKPNFYAINLKPLYTHPKQPLSDNEITNIYTDLFASRISLKFQDFARAIEQAHGIGVNNETA